MKNTISTVKNKISAKFFNGIDKTIDNKSTDKGDVIYFSESSKNVFSELSENIFGKFSVFFRKLAKIFSESSEK